MGAGEVGVHLSEIKSIKYFHLLYSKVTNNERRIIVNKKTNAIEELQKTCRENARIKYGLPLPATVRYRLHKELSLITSEEHAACYLLWQKQLALAKKEGFYVTVRATTGSTLVAYLLGISEINPLPPHYLCPSCKHMEIEGTGSGFDLPDRNCPPCGGKMLADGQDIPYEAFMGAEGELPPNIKVNASARACKRLEGAVPKESIVTPHELNNMIELLREFTGINAYDVPLNVSEAMSLFGSTEPLGIQHSDIGGGNIGVLGLLEPSSSFTDYMAVNARARNFCDLVRVIAISHGQEVWSGNGQDIIRSGEAELRELAACSEDVMQTLMEHGMERERAFCISEAVRKGEFEDNENMQEEMGDYGVPEWYIESCKKIKLLFPKAYAVEYALAFLRTAWYKLHYPTEFYAAFFSVYGCADTDYEILLGGADRIRKWYSEELMNSNQHRWGIPILLCMECTARGIRFLESDTQRSDERMFLPEDGNIRLPVSK